MEIAEATTETSVTFANPDGTLTSEISAGPERVKQGDEWVDIDTDLRAQADGNVRAAVPSSDLSLFGGDAAASVPVSGDRPLVSAKRPDGKALTLGWRGKLPKPVLQDETATYRDVSPGVDVRVQLTATGFRQHTVLKWRPTEPVSFTVPLRFTGLTVRTAAGGGAEFVDQAGKVAGVMAAPSMWGSELDAVSQLPARTAGVDFTLTPRDYGVDVTLKPDMAFLTDPATQYPVTIDPDVNFKGTFDTYVKQNTTTDMSAGTDLAIGVDTSGNPARAFINWDPAPIRGKQILEAHLGLWNSYSATCGNRALNVYSAGLATVATRWAYSGSGTTGQPSIAATASGSTDGSKGQASCAAGYIMTNPHALDQLVQGWANTTSGQVGMALKAPSETDVSYFKRVLSGDNVNYKPFMYVTYNDYPVAGTPSTSPSTSCVTGTGRPYISSATPTLKAVVSDAEGGPVTGVFEWSAVGGSKIGGATTASAAAGSTVSTTVPAGMFVNGSSYSWRVAGNDAAVNGVNGPWSLPCEFTVDTTAPTAPTVSSATYPANQWSGTATPVAGSFTFGAAGTTDVTKYTYRLDGGTTTTVQAGTLGGATTVTITPTTIGSATLSVTSYDRAGNASTITAYTFLVGTAAAVEKANLPQVSGRGILTKEGPTAPSASCVTGSGRPAVNTMTPQMWATFSHASATTVNADFEYATLNGVPLGVETVTSKPISGHVEAWVPDEVLTNDTAYKWRVRARNQAGTVAGDYSGWCEFVVHALLVGSSPTGFADGGYRPLSDLIPDVEDPQEEYGEDEPVPGVDDQPPYIPAPDTGEVVAETTTDESDLPEGAFVPHSQSTQPSGEAAVAVPQEGDISDYTASCPFDAAAVEAAGSAGVPSSGPDGQSSCGGPVPDAVTAMAAAAEEPEAMPFGNPEVNAEVGPDTPEAFEAEQNSQVTAVSKEPAPGDYEHIWLPDECIHAPNRTWLVGRYDACYWMKQSYNFTQNVKGREQWKGTVFFDEYRYARQSPIRGTWDFHVYLHVTSISGDVSGVRASMTYAECSTTPCTPRPLASSDDFSRIGKWVQFSATFTAYPENTSDKRLQHKGRIGYKAYAPGVERVNRGIVTESNWVRCDRALKEQYASTGCVVPNFIPTLYLSRKGRYPALANHIYSAQQSQLPGKPGGILDTQPGSEQALRRLYDLRLRNRNGNKACPSGLRQEVGAPDGYTCDEYPFRSTYQGAYTADQTHNYPRTFRFCKINGGKSRNGPNGYSRCFIPGGQNSNGGNWLARFYSRADGGQRILDNDKFYVKVS